MILGYPEWPAMVDCDSTGRYADYDEQTGEVIRYFVVFLDPKTPTRQRIQAAKIRKFISIAEVKQIRTVRYLRSSITFHACLALHVVYTMCMYNLRVFKTMMQSGIPVLFYTLPFAALLLDHFGPAFNFSLRNNERIMGYRLRCTFQ